MQPAGLRSTKRVSVLDAEGGPQARESPKGDSSQSLRARQKLKGPFMGPFCFLGVLDEDEDCCSINRVSDLDAAGPRIAQRRFESISPGAPNLKRTF